MRDKGFTYIIIVLIIMLFTTALFLVAKNVNYSENKTDPVIENYLNEINFLLLNDFNQETLNTFNLNFKDYVKSNNFDGKFCFVVFDQNYVYLSNFQDNNYSSINNQETLKIERESASNNIYFGNCVFDINDSENKIYFEITGDRERNIFRNYIPEDILN